MNIRDRGLADKEAAERPPLTVWIAQWWAEVVAQRKGLYDEPYRRVDGRRDVDLDGDRRTGGGPAGRRD
jgi:hypothetical protein